MLDCPDEYIPTKLRKYKINRESEMYIMVNGFYDMLTIPNTNLETVLNKIGAENFSIVVLCTNGVNNIIYQWSVKKNRWIWYPIRKEI